MKVSELIDQLQRLPQDALVYRADSEWGYSLASRVETVRLQRDKVEQPDIDPKEHYWEDLGYEDDDYIYFEGVTLR